MANLNPFWSVIIMASAASLGTVVEPDVHPSLRNTEAEYQKIPDLPFDWQSISRKALLIN